MAVQPPPRPQTFSRPSSHRESFGQIDRPVLQPVHTSLSPFEGRPASSIQSGPTVSQHQPHQPNVSQTAHNSFVGQNATMRSFGEANGHRQSLQPGHGPQIYTAQYSGVSVYEMEMNGIAIMRRRDDGWLNATQILKVAGVDKGKRTKVLEKEILAGDHEKVQGGYGRYQGTWIPYNRGRDFCRQYGVEDLLRPILEYDMASDMSGHPGQGLDTPTKEQAQAANRKRFYQSNIDSARMNQLSNGTFFQNISPTASSALAAMGRASRYDPSPSRLGGTQKRPDVAVRYASQQGSGGHEHQGGSQQSMRSERSFNVNGAFDSTYGTQRLSEGHEPPRKKMRPSSSQEPGLLNGELDASMCEGTPTEPSGSFVYTQAMLLEDEEGGPYCQPPLPAPTDRIGEEKQKALLELFTNTAQTDYSTYPALTQLSGQDLDIPIDVSANTALHWAATLGRVPLMKALISRGASITRGNIAGQTPLMSAVQVNNCLDHGCFPELLELLSPLIEVRDTQGRTILHHIAVSCGINGRSVSSKYYLEALLEFIVRHGGGSQSSHQDQQGQGRPIGMVRFMQHMVNAKDQMGNTALNLVARIGNRSIILQLLEVGADATLANYKGLRPVDFGVGTEQDLAAHQPFNHPSSPEKVKAPLSRIEEANKDVISSITTALSQASLHFATELRQKQEAIDRTNAKIRDLSTQQQQEQRTLESLRARAKQRGERRQRIANLRRAVKEQRNAGRRGSPTSTSIKLGDADEAAGIVFGKHKLPSSSDLEAILSSASSQICYAGPPLPTAPRLRTLLFAYSPNAQALNLQLSALKERSSELEKKYKKVISLCVGLDEAEVESHAALLLRAIENEGLGKAAGGDEGGGGGGDEEMGRIREFVRKIDDMTEE